jgi:RNA polymerase sigma-70 factor, ECF subfamily
MGETPVSLLERLRDRPDPEAWRELVDLYTPLLFRWLRRYSLQQSDAEDLVQEVLGVVVRQLPHFQHSQQRGAFRHWLRSILVNCLRNFWRAQRHRPVAAGGQDLARVLEQLEDPDSDLGRFWEQEHDRYIVQQLLERIEGELTPSTRLAFRRLVVEAGEADAVAAELGLSVNAILIAKSRVLRRLREEVRGFLD